MGDRPSVFVALQRLTRSFDRLRSGQRLGDTAREQLLAEAQEIGACGLPLVERRLREGSDQESLWAFEILLAMASVDELAERASECLARAAADPSANETARMMSLALMSEFDDPFEPDQAPTSPPQELRLDRRVSDDDQYLDRRASDDDQYLDRRASDDDQHLDAYRPPGEPSPHDALSYQDTQASQLGSLGELSRHLDSPPEIARAADHLAGELEPSELLALVESLCAVEGQRAEALLDELICRDDIGEQVRSELCRLAAPIRERRRSNRRQSQSGPLARAWLGTKADSKTVLIATQRIAGSRPARRRALCCALRDNILVDGMYGEDFSPRGVEREIMRPLERDGFVFGEIPVGAARALLGKAAKRTHRTGTRLPRAYFLGRHILGLSDEHVTARRREVTRDHKSALLARAMDLMAGDDHELAQSLLQRYRQAAPDDDAGASALGLCLLKGGDLEAATAHLRRAAALRPESSEHAWNLASAYHRAGDRAGCYLAMRDYVCCAPSPLEPGAHRDYACELVSTYERRVRLEFPEMSTTAVARAEQHAHVARRLTTHGNLREAATELRRALRVAADHHPSWFDLGMIHLQRGERSKARRCFERALKLQPSYRPALVALDELGPGTAPRSAAARPLPKPKTRPARKRRGARLSPI